MAILTCPDCGVKVQPEDLICFRCGANLPHTPYADDDIPSPTVSQQYLRPGDGRAMERVSAEIDRLVLDGGFASMEEANAALRDRFSGPMADLPSTATPPHTMGSPTRPGPLLTQELGVMPRAKTGSPTGTMP